MGFVKPTFRVIDGCPAFSDIAPYIAIVLQDSDAHANSIYRGDDAAAVLHRHGKHTQRELFEGFAHGLPGFLPANPPGFSTHELRSDGVAYPSVPRGAALPWWCQGFDVDDALVPRAIQAAGRCGWKLFQPYHSGSEFHHLNFQVQPPRPRPGSRLWTRIWHLRATLPRS